MHQKDNYIIVKDRQPRISEVLNDCSVPLCVSAKKGEPLSSILQKICAEIQQVGQQSLTFQNSDTIAFNRVGNTVTASFIGNTNTYISEGSFIDITGTGSQPDPFVINAQNIYNTNGTLTSNRTITQAGFYTNFTGGAFVVSGDVGSTPISADPNPRLMWVPAKQAFRVGTPATASGWDNVNIGPGSMALGRNTYAQGEDSVALGGGSGTTGMNSFAAIGGQTNAESSIAMGLAIANGYSSVAIGPATTNAQYAIAMGNAANAAGDYSIAIGQEAFASGEFSVHITTSSGSAQAQYSTSVGYQNTASGIESMATGANSSALARSSFTLGRDTRTSHYGETVVGMFNNSVAIDDTPYTASQRVFTVGNGTGNATRSNALIVYKGGIGLAKFAVNPGTDTTVPTNTMRIYGDLRVDTVTAVPTKLIGATANNVLGALTLGAGISIVGGQLQFTAGVGDNIYTADGTLSGARTVNMAGFPLQFTNAGLFRIEDTNTVGDDGIYDFNQGIDFLTYNATNSTQIFSNMLEGSGLTYRDQVTPANDVELYVASEEITLDNPVATGTFFKIADYSTKTAGDALILSDPLTGEVGWSSLLWTVNSILGNETLDETNFVIFADATSGNITITLPSAAANNGRRYIIKKTDVSANTVSFVTVEGSQTLSTQYAGNIIISNGTGWYIIGTF